MSTLDIFFLVKKTLSSDRQQCYQLGGKANLDELITLFIFLLFPKCQMIFIVVQYFSSRFILRFHFFALRFLVINFLFCFVVFST